MSGALAGLIPHRGRMCLLERVLHFDDEHIVAVTGTHRAPDHPLARQGRLRALHLCEYGAQAMAVHGALVAGAAGARAEPGLLVALREVELACLELQDLPGEIEVRAQRLLATDAGWQYEFSAWHAGERLARGRAAVMRA